MALSLGSLNMSTLGLDQIGLPTIPELTGQEAAKEQARGARQAGEAQAAAIEKGIAEQARQFNIQQEALRPYREIGLAGLQQYQQAVGQAPEDVPALQDWGGFSLQDMVSDPGYQFRLQQGTQAIERAAAARGGRLAGGTLADLANYSQGLASQEFQAARQRALQDYGLQQQTQLQQYGLTSGARSDYLNRLAALGGIGQSSTGTLTNLSSQYAANMGNLYGQMGQTQAQSILGQSNAAAAGSLGARNLFMDAAQIGAMAYGAA